MRRLLRTALVLALAASTRAAPAGDDEWTTLFDGRSLAGWTTVGGPYDGRAVWTVEDGAITGREGEGHAGGLLYTEGTYEDFELELEAFVSWPFDSGVFARMRPDARGAQLTLDHRPGGEIGGVYADGWWWHNPQGERAWRKHDWNRLRLRCAGDPMHLVFEVNGQRITDYRLPEAATGFARDGRIGLQVHGGGAEGGVVRFRDLRVRRLDRAAGRLFTRDEAGRLALTEAGRALGWRDLLAGPGLAGWTPASPGTGYAVEDGVLALLAEGQSPHLATNDDFRDFHLRLDFKIARMANSGVFLRAARDGSNPAFSGCEIQILDDFDWEADTHTTLKPWQFTGSLYGAVAPGRRDAVRAVGAWNVLEVVMLGRRVETSLNGVVLYDVDTSELEVEPPFAARAPRGFIGIQRHAPASALEGAAYAWFRNVFVRPLSAP